MLLFPILLHTNNNNGDSFLVLLQQTTLPIEKYLLLIMPIQKNNSCRMGGPKKGQWVTIILIRASTAGVCENYNLLPSEILPMSYLLTWGNLFLSSSPTRV